MVDFTNFDPESLFGIGDDSNPLLWLIWIVPIFIFLFYGQRIQLQIASGEIRKNITKLKQFKDTSRSELLGFVKKLHPKSDPEKKMDRFIDYFTIMPVDMDPHGIVPKVRHLVRSREDVTRKQVKAMFSEISLLDATKVQTLVEVATSLQMIYKIVNHLYLTAKKQHNYPLMLPLQMMLPFIMEEATALNESVSALKQGQPIGDGIGPLVVGKMMLDTTKQTAALETVWSESNYKERQVFFLKAEGPSSTVGRPGDAVEHIFSKNKPDVIIMVDASVKMEGEESATTAQGFGAAIGGIGTERFQIEELATKYNIPVFAIVIKQSIKEAITLMTKEIADKADDVREQIYEMIEENTKKGQKILVIGIGNTLGVSQ